MGAGDGVYFLSNPREVQELMRDIDKRVSTLTNNGHMDGQTAQSVRLNEIIMRVEALEQKMRIQEEYVTKAVTAIAQEFTVLRDNIDEQMAEQQKQILVSLENAYNRRVVAQETEESWKQEIEERYQHIAELVGKLENSIRDQSSFALWVRQLFGCQPKQ